MLKVEQKINLEGSYHKIGTKFIHTTTGHSINILKRKSPTLIKPPFYLFSNTLGRDGYISSLYPLGGDFQQSPDTKEGANYSLEYKGIGYKLEVKETEVLIIKHNLTF